MVAQPGHDPHTLVDIALNNTMRIVSGCLRPTCGIAPPAVRRSITVDAERTQKDRHPHHVMYGQNAATPRLKYRKSFLSSTTALEDFPPVARAARWSKEEGILCEEELASGCDLAYVSWLTLNQIRTGCGRTATNLTRWGIQNDVCCPNCGMRQDDDHLLACGLETAHTREELWRELNDGATELTQRSGRV